MVFKMALQAELSTERTAAIRTSKWSFPCMNASVLLETPVVSESPSAQCAHALSLITCRQKEKYYTQKGSTRVHFVGLPHVGVQVTFLATPMSTQGTSERLLSAMNPHVLFHCPSIFANLAA